MVHHNYVYVYVDMSVDMPVIKHAKGTYKWMDMCTCTVYHNYV